jgi:hypothetical protein
VCRSGGAAVAIAGVAFLAFLIASVHGFFSKRSKLALLAWFLLLSPWTASLGDGTLRLPQRNNGCTHSDAIRIPVASWKPCLTRPALPAPGTGVFLSLLLSNKAPTRTHQPRVSRHTHCRSVPAHAASCTAAYINTCTSIRVVACVLHIAYTTCLVRHCTHFRRGQVGTQQPPYYNTLPLRHHGWRWRPWARYRVATRS